MKFQNNFIFTFSVLVVLSFWGCSKPDTALESKQSINTGWNWVRTDGGFANHIHETPASTGKNINLLLRSDNTYSIYTNGVLTSQGTYLVESRVCIHDQSYKNVLNFSSPSDQDMMIEKLDNSTLELSDDNYDGFRTIYSKN